MLLIEPFYIIRIYSSLLLYSEERIFEKVNNLFAFQNYVSPCMCVPPLKGLYLMKIQAKYVCCIVIYMLQTGGGEELPRPPPADAIGFTLLYTIFCILFRCFDEFL